MKSIFALTVLAVAVQAGGDRCTDEVAFVNNKFDCNADLTVCTIKKVNGACPTGENCTREEDRTEDLLAKCYPCEDRKAEYARRYDCNADYTECTDKKENG